MSDSVVDEALCLVVEEKRVREKRGEGRSAWGGTQIAPPPLR